MIFTEPLRMQSQISGYLLRPRIGYIAIVEIHPSTNFPDRIPYGERQLPGAASARVDIIIISFGPSMQYEETTTTKASAPDDVTHKSKLPAWHKPIHKLHICTLLLGKYPTHLYSQFIWEKKVSDTTSIHDNDSFLARVQQEHVMN